MTDQPGRVRAPRLGPAGARAFQVIEPALSPHEAMAEALLADPVLEAGASADLILRLLVDYGYELAPSGSTNVCHVLSLLAQKVTERGIGVSASLLLDVSAGTVTAAEVEGI